MKDGQLKSLIKTARKAIENELQSGLAVQLSEATGKMGKPSKQLEKVIKKGTKRLAKKLSKEVRIDKSVLVEAKKAAKASKKLGTATELKAEGVLPKAAKPEVQKKKLKVTTETQNS